MPLWESRGKPPYKYYGGDTVRTPTSPAVYSWQSRLSGKDPDPGKDRGQEEKGATESKMVGWRHEVDGREFKQTQGDGEGQGSLACCSPWSQKESDMTEELNNNPQYKARGCEGRPYSLYCVILYKELEHPRNLVSAGASGANALWTPRG